MLVGYIDNIKECLESEEEKTKKRVSDFILVFMKEFGENDDDNFIENKIRWENMMNSKKLGKINELHD